MLCTQVLNGFAGAMNGIVRFNIGREFNVVTVSIDPRDTAQDAAAAKKKYLQRYRRPEAEQGWHFLTGKKDQIDALAQAVGFRYAWDPEIKQYAHASGIMLLTPQGRVAQYYYGIEYAPRDIQLGLIEASKGKIGNVVDQVVLYCYHYDPRQGRYGAAIFNVLRLSALATVLALGGFMLIMFRRDSLAAREGRATRTAH
jgi:protein SCO1/2